MACVWSKFIQLVSNLFHIKATASNLKKSIPLFCKNNISLINTMIGRANNHQYKTKEMNEAVKIFKKRLKELVN